MQSITLIVAGTIGLSTGLLAKWVLHQPGVLNFLAVHHIPLPVVVAGVGLMGVMMLVGFYRSYVNH